MSGELRKVEPSTGAVRRLYGDAGSTLYAASGPVELHVESEAQHEVWTTDVLGHPTRRWEAPGERFDILELSSSGRFIAASVRLLPPGLQNSTAFMNPYALVVLDVETGEVSEVISPIVRPSIWWSPDESHLAMTLPAWETASHLIIDWRTGEQAVLGDPAGPLLVCLAHWPEP